MISHCYIPLNKHYLIPYPGEILFSELPYSGVLLPDQYSTHCHHCFRKYTALMPCRNIIVNYICTSFSNILLLFILRYIFLRRVELQSLNFWQKICPECFKGFIANVNLMKIHSTSFIDLFLFSRIELLQLLKSNMFLLN